MRTGVVEVQLLVSARRGRRTATNASSTGRLSRSQVSLQPTCTDPKASARGQLGLEDEPSAISSLKVLLSTSSSPAGPSSSSQRSALPTGSACGTLVPYLTPRSFLRPFEPDSTRLHCPPSSTKGSILRSHIPFKHLIRFPFFLFVLHSAPLSSSFLLTATPAFVPSRPPPSLSQVRPHLPPAGPS